MSDFSASQFSPLEGGLFGPHELDRLMRAEFTRARRYGHPLTGLSIGVDRLGALHDLYGRDAKREIYRSVLGALRADTRASDFLAALVDDRMLVLVPHTPLEGVRAMVRRLMRRVRKLKVEGENRALELSLSVGACSGRGDELADVDAFLTACGEAQRKASLLGGDRLVEGHPPVPRPAEPAPLAAPARDDVLTALARRLEAEGGMNLADALFDLLKERQAGARPTPAAAPAAGGGEDQLELLERRIAKMSELLERVERSIANLETRPADAEGVAAPDRSGRAQTLDALRKELMGRIFEANVALRREVESRKASPDDR